MPLPPTELSTGPSTGPSIEEDATALAEPASREADGTAPTEMSDGVQASSSTGDGGPQQRVAQIGMMLGRYRLDTELGEGGMASVFGARDTKLGRDVAIKVMFPHLARRKEAASRFKREARAAAGLDHEHILRVFDVGGGEIEDGVLVPPYIVLERIDGASLDDFFREHEAPMAEVVAAMGVALCRGLAQAHAHKIVHRDIKPANVMVTKKGRLVLADFGVARVGEDDSVETRTGAVLGTPAYMSPEQASGEKVDSRSDLYSLGATLYRIATGSVPYAGSAAQIVAGILDGKRIPAEQRDPRIGRELSRTIDKLMQRDPDDRFQTAEETEKALLEIVGGGGDQDCEELLREFVRDPEAQLERNRDTVISASLMRARRLAVEGRAPAALAIAERVLALAPDNAQAKALCDDLGRPKKDKRLLLAIFGPMVVTGVVGAVFWGSRPGPISTYADAGLSDAWQVPADASGDDAATALVDGGPIVHDAAAAELRKPDVRPRPKARTVDAGDVLLPPSKADAAVAVIAPPASPARLIVDVTPWCDVWIDGAKHQRASKKNAYELAPGTYEVECKQPGTGKSSSKSVSLTAGELRTVTGSVLDPVTVAVRLSNGDAITIGSTRIANGESGVLTAGRPRVQVWKNGKPQGQSQLMTIRESCVMRDEPQLACAR